MKHWRQLAAIVLAGAMVFALAACGLTAKETPATEPTPTEDVQAPTGEGTIITESMLPVIDPETYRPFIYTWYADGSSASYKLNIKDDGTWELVDSIGEVAASGSLRMNDEDGILEMYDPDGSLAISATLEKEDTILIELMLESLSDSLNTNIFLNVITNNTSDAPPADVEEEHSTTIDEETGAVPPMDDSAEIPG